MSFIISARAAVFESIVIFTGAYPDFYPFYIDVFSIGKSGFLDYQIRISDFPIKHEIQKRISTQRNPSPRWISINQSKLSGKS